MGSNPQIRILYASRFVEEKGVDILIRLIERTLQDPTFSQISWIICGDGPRKIDIQNLSKTSSRVEYLGILDAKNLKDQYRSADFLFMPSRFLETFGLTALESLTCETPVIGIKKGGISPFIHTDLALDEKCPLQSSLRILERVINGECKEIHIPVDEYRLDAWKDRAKSLFGFSERLLLLHDYLHRIGGAEYYREFLEKTLPEIGISHIQTLAYPGNTTPWKRRFLFFLSFFAFWRGIIVKRTLKKFQPDTLWMHSVLRYYGYWGMLAVNQYVKDYPDMKIFLSHHDVGMIAPFPQHVEHEDQIPRDTSLSSFISGESSFFRKTLAMIKWCYVASLRKHFPVKGEHIIFASFLEKHIAAHFPGQKIHVLPHTVDAIYQNP